MFLSRPILAVLAALPLAFAPARAADLPRQAPELVINTTGGTPIKLSQYRGKVVAVCFILTTCPHCQKTIGLLIPMQNEYGPRGFQVLASAIEQGAAFALPRFLQTFNPPFPVGFNDPSVAIDFMQHPAMLVPMMPMLAFVDRQGKIRDQHEGNDEKFFEDQQEQNIRKQIEALLNPAPGAQKKSPPKKAGTVKKSN